MKKQTFSSPESNEEIITSKSYNDDRTLAFKINRQPHKADSISWVVGSFFMFAFLVLSVGRLTIVGQFFDDVLFSFLFGWMKYLTYLILFGVNLAILIGLKFNFKKTFLIMIVVFWLNLAWIISTAQMLATTTTMWSKDLFMTNLNQYLTNWKDNSVFGLTFENATGLKFAFWNNIPSYVNVGQSGGIGGTIIAGALSYMSLPASLVLATFTFCLTLMWIFTGNPVYLFLPKKKRKGKRLRLLSLKKNNNPYINIKARQWEAVDVEDLKQNPTDNLIKIEEEVQKKSVLWDEITMMNNENESSLLTEKKSDEDQTFEFKNYDEELNQNFYHKKSTLKTKEEFLEEQKAEFENLNPDQVRDKFAREFSDIRPYGDLPFERVEDDEPVDNFVPFKEASLDDTDFLNDLAAETHLPDFVDEPSTTDLIIVEDEVETNQPYILPEIQLLDDVKQERRLFHENQAYALSKQDAIDETFNQFKVGAKVVNVVYGPAVIKFEIQPDPGTKVNSISALENDLKLALASQNLRIEAPIPGKNLVGIEIENKHRLVVGLKEMMIELDKVNPKNKLVFALGKDVENKPVFGDLAKMPHLLVAGSTGSGKSVMINTLIVSLLMRTTPEELKFLLIDPKKVELAIYSHLPHMLMPVISDMTQAAQALKVIIAEMERRYELFANCGAKNLDGYNRKQTESSKKLPYYVVIIDELADLMMTVNRKEVEDSIMRITQMARAAGIHLIVATQRPSVDVITGVIKANIPSRIAFSVATSTDSRTILDSGGAEKLTGKGDMLYVPAGSSDLIRAQGAYLSDEEIERVIEFIQSQQQEKYQQSFIKQVERNTLNVEDNVDDLYEEIKQYVIKSQKASASLLERKFSIGHNRAARLIDQLEEEGIVGPQNGTKPRDVLVNN